jgi:hypothetical protein
MFGDNPNKADVYAWPSDYFGSPESEPLTIVYRRPRVHDMCYINTQHDNGIMFVWLLSLSGVPSSSQNKLSKVYKEVFFTSFVVSISTDGFSSPPRKQLHQFWWDGMFFVFSSLLCCFFYWFVTVALSVALKLMQVAQRINGRTLGRHVLQEVSLFSSFYRYPSSSGFFSDSFRDCYRCCRL